MFAKFKPTRKGDYNAYIVRSFRNNKGDKTSSVIVERLGILSEIAAAHPEMDLGNGAGCFVVRQPLVYVNTNKCQI